MSNRIKVGIVGVHPERGWAGMAHVPALKSLPQYEITAISNSDPEQARLAAAKFGVANALTSTDALVNHPDVDLVVVSVRVPHHRDVATKAIEAGKAVFTEWPLAQNLDEAIELTELAKRRGVRTAIGLQTRVAPGVAYVRDLMRQGYAGDVLSTSLIVSGISWGEEMPKNFAYTLDSASGAGMVHIPVAHTLDAVSYLFGSEFAEFDSTFAVRRKAVRIADTGETLPMRTPDQVAVSGRLASGVFVNAHFRGGLSKGSNFRWEINGTKGDLLIENHLGYVGLGGFRVSGAQGQEELKELLVPASYGAGMEALGMGQNVALLYAQLASDIQNGTRLAPTFEDAVRLHRFIAAIEERATHAAGPTIPDHAHAA